jgi:hypothetical protein
MNNFFLLVFLCCQTDNTLVQPVTPAQVIKVAEDINSHINTTVSDYTGLLVKREYVSGKDTGYQYIQFKYRENPRAVYLKFLKPAYLQNREVLYNGGEDLVVKRGGRKNASMTMYLAIDSPLATDGNRYTIKDMGLKVLSERLLQVIKTEVNIPDTEIKVYNEAKVDGRTVRFYRMVHNVQHNKEQCYIAEIAVDKELCIPIYYKALGYGKDDEPVVLEEYSFRNIELNVGLKDEDFDEQNKEYGFKKKTP